ncbi:MAG: CAP family protein [Devosia sp.]
MKMFATALAVGLIAAFAAPAFAQDISGEVLSAHNALRAKHGVPPLSWSGKLAATAQEWANACVFEHRTGSGLGENLAQGDGFPMSQFVNDWYNEIGQYDFNNPGFSDGTGHFTQVVWKSTKHVGCGVAQCSGGALLVCNYSPAGNLEGAYPENVPPVQ